MSNVICTINGVRVPVLYAGPQGNPGLDQINVRVWPELKASMMPLFGFVTVSADGIVANPAWLQFALSGRFSRSLRRLPLFLGFVELSIDGIVANSVWLQFR